MSYLRAARPDEVAKWLRDNFWTDDADGPKDPDELAAALVEKYDLITESLTQ